MPARVLLRRLMKKADKALSEYVRELAVRRFGKCPLCNERPVQCCFHFVRRRRKVLRWDVRNVVGACHTCNYVEYRDPDLSRAWYIRRFGVERYLELVDKSREDFAPTEDYLVVAIMFFEAQLEKLRGESGGDQDAA